MKQAENAEPVYTVENRRQPRMCCQPTLVYVHLAGYDRPVEAQMIEVSSRGLQLQLNQPLPVGADLTIDTGELKVRGEVRHCQAQPNYCFIIGILKHDDAHEDSAKLNP
jgi:hypothetical protein